MTTTKMMTMMMMMMMMMMIMMMMMMMKMVMMMMPVMTVMTVMMKWSTTIDVRPESPPVSPWLSVSCSVFEPIRC